mmetsp:Transcript_20876/g.59152  ORF Transcript_20876/g.59152 Transcript_20876/m.59152 type:complete len:131 (-) Transcript_20876:86-478(-)
MAAHRNAGDVAQASAADRPAVARSEAGSRSDDDCSGMAGDWAVHFLLVAGIVTALFGVLHWFGLLAGASAADKPCPAGRTYCMHSLRQDLRSLVSLTLSAAMTYYLRTEVCGAMSSRGTVKRFHVVASLA